VSFAHYDDESESKRDRQERWSGGEPPPERRLTLRERLISKGQGRKPDFVITDEALPDEPYMLRWYLIPRNRFLNIYLHKFLRSDTAEALHDHPWLFNISWILENEYTEVTVLPGGVNRRIVYQEGAVKPRLGAAPHRVELHNGPVWTLFVTGPVFREWGFHCPKGWVQFKRFSSYQKGSSVQKGCPE
jgi:hypothetical protein